MDDAMVLENGRRTRKRVTIRLVARSKYIVINARSVY